MSDQQHDKRRAWFQAFFEEAARDGVTQVTDELLIEADQVWRRGGAPWDACKGPAFKGWDD